MKKVLLAVCAILVGLQGSAEQRTKVFKKSFPASGLQELTIWNRYGNIDICQEGETFEVEATVFVEAKTQVKVDELLEYIHVSAEEQNSTLNVRTILEKDLSVQQLLSGVSFGIDYQIKIPTGKKLRIVAQEGNVTLGDFVGDVNVEIVSGNFKANSVKGKDFTAKLSKGEFEVEHVGAFNGVFKSAKVKIGDGTRMQLDCNSSTLQLMEADQLTIKSSGGSAYLGMIEHLMLNTFYTKYEIQDIGSSLRVDARYGEVNVRNIHFSFSSVELKGSSTKVGLTFMEGCGYNLELKQSKRMKVDLPESFALTEKPTSEKGVIVRTGFIGDKKYSGKVVLNLSGGNLFIQ